MVDGVHECAAGGQMLAQAMGRNDGVAYPVERPEQEQARKNEMDVEPRNRSGPAAHQSRRKARTQHNAGNKEQHRADGVAPMGNARRNIVTKDLVAAYLGVLPMGESRHQQADEGHKEYGPRAFIEQNGIEHRTPPLHLGASKVPRANGCC